MKTVVVLETKVVYGTFQSSEVVGVIVLERSLVQLDDDTDQSLFSFVVGELISASYHSYLSHLSLSVIPGHGGGGGGSLPRSSPGSSIGVLGHYDSGDLAMTPAAPDSVLGSVTPDVLRLPSRQHHCNVDKWRSLDVRCGADRPPTMENGPYAVEPP